MLYGGPNINQVYQLKDASSFTINTRQSATRLIYKKGKTLKKIKNNWNV